MLEANGGATGRDLNWAENVVPSSLDLAPFIPFLTPPQVPALLECFSVRTVGQWCLSSYLPPPHATFQTWVPGASPGRGQSGMEGFLFAPSVKHLRTIPIVLTCGLGLVQRFLKLEAIGSLWFTCSYAAT